jgi:hypothetical protein
MLLIWEANITAFNFRYIFYCKKNCYIESGKELSEKKGFAIIKEFLLKIREKLFKSTRTFYRLIIKIKDKLLQDGKKDKRYKKKTAFDILKDAVISID